MARTKKKAHPMLQIWLEKLGEKLRERRELTWGKKQEQLAVAAGVTRAMVSIIENGTRGYGIEALLRVVSAIEGGPKQKTVDPVAAILSASKEASNLTPTEINTVYKVIGAISNPERRTRTLKILDLIDEAVDVGAPSAKTRGKAQAPF